MGAAITGSHPDSPIYGRPEPGDTRLKQVFARVHRARILLFLAIIAAAAAITWKLTAPVGVILISPEAREITETVAASGIVTGRREAVVGARIPGIVSELLVREGDHVNSGDLIARISNEVAEAQLDQARQGVTSARAAVRLAAVRPRSSELDAARARVRQAEASLAELLPMIDRANIGVSQAESAADQADAQAIRARAAVLQAEARRELAENTVTRYRTLFDEGAISAQSLDQMVAELASASADKTAAQQGVAAADLAAESARRSITAAQKDVEALRTRAVAANASFEAAQADFRTLAAGPRFESVETAREGAHAAEIGVAVARMQIRMSDVRAPFTGIVTEVTAEKGASAAATGVVKLVETASPEIRLDVDENNLADLKPGLRAVITSTAYRTLRAEGKVIRVGSKVDSARGTVEIVVAPSGSTDRLRPGQTVNVNVILSERARKMVVPSSAIRMEAGRTVVLEIVNGEATPRQVETGPTKEGKIPILDGLEAGRKIIFHAESLRTGTRVKAVK